MISHEERKRKRLNIYFNATRAPRHNIAQVLHIVRNFKRASHVARGFATRGVMYFEIFHFLASYAFVLAENAGKMQTTRAKRTACCRTQAIKVSHGGDA